LFDIPIPEEPKFLSHFDCSGPPLTWSSRIMVCRWKIHSYVLRFSRL
jgi:hypothetical protein